MPFTPPNFSQGRFRIEQMYILPMRKVRRSDDEIMRIFYVDQHAVEMMKSYDEHLIEKIPKRRETQCPEFQRRGNATGYPRERKASDQNRGDMPISDNIALGSVPKLLIVSNLGFMMCGTSKPWNTLPGQLHQRHCNNLRGRHSIHLTVSWRMTTRIQIA